MRRLIIVQHENLGSGSEKNYNGSGMAQNVTDPGTLFIFHGSAYLALERVLIQAVTSDSEAARSTKAKVCITFPSTSCLVLISTLDTEPNLQKNVLSLVFILIHQGILGVGKGEGEDADYPPPPLTSVSCIVFKLV